MLFASLFILELLILYLLSRHISILFSRFFHRLTRNKNITVILLAIFFLPGTLIHEVSHWLMAVILFVPVGNISVIPVLEKEKVKLGSVAIARTDPFRRLAIGIAPVLIGLTIIIASIYLSIEYDLFNNNWIILLLIYFIFQIGNTMFSSKKDTEGSLGLFLLIILISISWYIMGLNYPAFNPSTFFSLPLIESVLTKACLYLAAPITIDLLLISIAKIFTKKILF